MLDENKLSAYKLAAKKTKELGYPLTKDRIWDQYVFIGINNPGLNLLEKHKSEPYFNALKEVGLCNN